MEKEEKKRQPVEQLFLGTTVRHNVNAYSRSLLPILQLAKDSALFRVEVAELTQQARLVALRNFVFFSIFVLIIFYLVLSVSRSNLASSATSLLVSFHAFTCCLERVEEENERKSAL